MRDHKKLIIISITAVVLISGSIFALGMSNNSDDTSDNMSVSPENSLSTEATQQEPTSVNKGPTQSGTYIDYSQDALANAQGTKILFFHASWCSQCRQLENDINTTGLPGGVTVLKVDYDNANDLRKRYGVTLQTTLVRVNSNGDLIKKYVAYDNPSVKSIVENLL